VRRFALAAAALLVVVGCEDQDAPTDVVGGLPVSSQSAVHHAYGFSKARYGRHTYVMYRNYAGGAHAVVHDPDCSCKEASK
jgi:hypothetical protein